MAGCFGNNFFDRAMERQLMRHLYEEERQEQEEIKREQEERGKKLAEEGMDYMIEKAIKKGIGVS